MRNFNLLLRKDVTYDNIKSHKKQELYALFTLSNGFLEKPQRESNWSPQLFKG